MMLAVTSSLACSSKPAADQPQTERSQRERDSTIGASQLPGAQGVRGALRVADSAAARQARIDSAGQDP